MRPSESLNSFSRRECLKAIVLGIAQAGVGGGLFQCCFAADVKAQSPNTEGILNLNLANFPALQKDNGSILFKVPGLVSFPQLVVTRLPNNEFHAVTSVCTHQGCTVQTYNAVQHAIVCPCHQSRFAADGKVLNGPATRPLTSYPTQFDGVSSINIVIPGLGYRLSIVAMASGSGGTGRIGLEFPTSSNARYEVRQRSSLNSGNWTQTSFSLTPEGPLDQTQLTGTGSPAIVYVNQGAGAGFFVVNRF